jgi:hypothetical protein
VTRLYPAAWRQRYGDEFEALLEDKPPTLFCLFDLIKGATKMQLSVPTFPKLALLLSVAGLLAGWGVSFLVTPSYVSQATLQFAPKFGSSPAELPPEVLAMQQQILSRTSLSAIIADPRLDLYRSERSRQPLEDVIETMRRDLHFSPAGTSATFTISFSYRDPKKAHDTVHTLIANFHVANLERQRAAPYAKRQRNYDQIDRMEARITALEKRLGIPPTPSEPLDQLVSVSPPINLYVLDPRAFPSIP